MKYMHILSALSLAALVLGAPEAIPEEKRQVVGDVTSFAGDVTSAAGSIFTEATSLAGQVGTVVTSIGGKAFTEVTEAGGAVITLAESGAGVVTTFAGSVYTVATAAAASAATGTKNEAGANVLSLQISSPLFAALATTAGGVLIGAWVAF
ncbi:hypothetical protein BGW80DRAFT_1252268 [Lactifluus volemus]|nr:hypothetical protein BGW80DRAFT_1252268 [Lactifluus volemus]